MSMSGSGKKHAGKVTQRYALEGTRIHFDGLNWYTVGDTGQLDYTVIEHEKAIASVGSESFGGVDHICLTIQSKRRILPAIAMVLAVQMTHRSGA